MIELNKKQVGALLKVVGKDSIRPILENIKIQEHEQKIYAVATNSYVGAALELDAEDAEPIKGKLIRRSALEKWHKLATGKNRLTTQELVEVSSQDYADNGSYEEGDYPNILEIIPEHDVTEPIERLGVNAEYYKILQDLADKPLHYNFHGAIRGVTAVNEGDLFIIMPIKG